MVATTTSDTSLQRRATVKSCHAPPPPPEAPPLPCPRCDSTNTKFCYYNNYNFSQPRHFCKSCRRYWTQGGTLRDIPIGGGSRKNTAKRFRTTPAAASSAHNTFQHSPAAGGSLVPFSGEVQYHHVFGGGGGGGGGSFTSLLSGSGLLGMGGFGLDDVGFGFPSNVWPFGGTDTWQVGDGSFALPELAISSTPTTDFMK